MKRELDRLDKQILDCLYDDVRLSNRQVASTLGVTEGTVRSRIARMRKDNLVRFTATLDAGTENRPVSGIIGINVEGGKIDDVSQALAALPEVNFAGKMLGRYDIFCTYVVNDNDGLAYLLQSVLPSIDGIKSTESLHVVQVFKFDRRWSVLGLNE